MDTPGATWPGDQPGSARSAGADGSLGTDTSSGQNVSWPLGWHVSVVGQTGSTNADLLAAAAAGAPDRSVLMAQFQSAGRGRLGRVWEAPAGANLLVSILFRSVPHHPVELTWRVALAAAEACAALTGLEPTLKWPNDLLLGDAKLAGVLAQSAPGLGGAIDHVVVGIGVNVGWGIDGAATLGGICTPTDLLVELLRRYDALPANLIDAYRRRLATLGQRVRIELPSGAVVTGRAVDVGVDGRLEVLDEHQVVHRFDTGDIVHLRPAQA